MRGSRRLYYGWILIWGLGLATIVSYGTTQYFFGVLLVPVQHDLGWSRAEISGAFSAAFVVAGVLGLPIGGLLDRRGARLLMSAGSLLGAASLLLLSRSDQLWQFYLLWGGGIGLAMALTLYPVTFTVVTNWFRQRRGTALAVLTLLGGLASPIFVPAAGYLVAVHGWRSTLVVFGAAQLLVALPLHGLLLRRHPEDMGLLPDGRPLVEGTRAAAASGLQLRAAVATRAFWTLTIASGLTLFAHSAVLGHQVAFMIGRGFDPILAAALAGLVGLASLPGRVIFNLVSDRFGAQTLLALCTGLQAVGAVLLLMATSALWLWAYVAVYGIAFGATSPLRASTMADQFGRRSYGIITAAGGLPIALAGAAGPLVAGYLFDRLRGYEAALGLVIAAFALAAAIVAVTPRPAPESRPWSAEPAGAGS